MAGASEDTRLPTFPYAFPALPHHALKGRQGSHYRRPHVFPIYLPHLRYNPRNPFLTFIKTETMMNTRTGARVSPWPKHGKAARGWRLRVRRGQGPVRRLDGEGVFEALHPRLQILDFSLLLFQEQVFDAV
jgi:hypothetical protein